MSWAKFFGYTKYEVHTVHNVPTVHTMHTMLCWYSPYKDLSPDSVAKSQNRRYNHGFQRFYVYIPPYSVESVFLIFNNDLMELLRRAVRACRLSGSSAAPWATSQAIPVFWNGGWRTGRSATSKVVVAPHLLLSQWAPPTPFLLVQYEYNT
ncbi:hypothetical protein N656DRAFT_134132 [Canariomyces notabilis]|uniref:Uncharacterized protein n=1 Tax=Canariomyces notabilis TaxID=2074819 RepID=A0AAN6TCR7_9PEZI|nr:hypothetical protein N656DRAFT_134132 [Canariomyces arenarius]